MGRKQAKYYNFGFNIIFLFQHFVRNLFHKNEGTMRKVLKKRKVLNKYDITIYIR